MVHDRDKGREVDPHGIVDLLSHDQNTRCLYMFVPWVVGSVRLKAPETLRLVSVWCPKSEMTARKTRTTRTQKKTESGSGLLSPPSSTGDKAGDRDAAGPSSTMISPPPEEDEGQGSKVS